MSLEMLRNLFARPHPVENIVGDMPALPVEAVGDLERVLAAAGMKQPVLWAGHLAEPCRRFAIRPGRRLAAFAATIAHESAGGTRLTENMMYSARRVMATWPSRFPTLASAQPYAWDPTDPDREDVALANEVYGRRMGNAENGVSDDDGWTYRGRGLIQITGRDGYRRAGRALSLPLEVDPDMAAQEGPSALIAAWVWAEWKGCNGLADAGDVKGWRRGINGGLIGLDDVRSRYEAALAA